MTPADSLPPADPRGLGVPPTHPKLSLMGTFYEEL
jgi:hypothetical protein